MLAETKAASCGRFPMGTFTQNNPLTDEVPKYRVDHQFRHSNTFWQFVSVGLYERSFVLCLSFRTMKRKCGRV
jgi:hypothetical protein